MRSAKLLHPLRSVLRRFSGGPTSLLLSAAMVAPIVDAGIGWPVQTPLGVPLRVHAAMLAAVALVAFGLAERDDRLHPTRRWARWVLVAPIAVVLAVIVHYRANVFYTERALIEGMTALFTLHVVIALLRQRAVRRLDLSVAEPETPHRWRRGAAWRRRIRARCLPVTPGVRLADALTAVVGWLVLAAWVLIALEHRHPAGPLLLAAGAAESLALLALLPDTLAGMGWLSARSAAEDGDDGQSGGLALVRNATHATSCRTPHLRRHT